MLMVIINNPKWNLIADERGITLYSYTIYSIPEYIYCIHKTPAVHTIVLYNTQQSIHVEENVVSAKETGAVKPSALRTPPTTLKASQEPHA